MTYGFNAQADVRAVNLRYEKGVAHFDVALQAEGRMIEGCSLPMPGDHNVSNALSAVAVARHLGMKRAEIRAALASFGGVNRRFTRVGEVDGVTVIDDYGHHPVEIAAVLRAARQACDGPRDRGASAASLLAPVLALRRFLRLFQRGRRGRHRRGLCGGRRPDPRCLARRSGRGAHPARAPARGGIWTTRTIWNGWCANEARPGDMVVCLGAGTISAWANALPGRLRG